MEKGKLIINCKTCIHERACAVWIHHGKILYDDFEYSVENCPYYAKVMYGWWIVENETSVRCSECCFNRASIKMPLDYCPNCGTRMDGGN